MPWVSDRAQSQCGMLNEGAVPNSKELNHVNYDCVTALTGRALADLLKPGVDAQW